MDKGKSETVCMTFRLNEEESEKLKQCAAACGLSVAEFVRQLCKGNTPQPKPPKEFWELLDSLYEMHDTFKKNIPTFPTAAEICKEIERLVVDLQQRFTMPQKTNVGELIQKGAI